MLALMFALLRLIDDSNAGKWMLHRGLSPGCDSATDIAEKRRAL